MFSALRVEDVGGASTADPALPGTSRARGRRLGRPAEVSSSERPAAAPLAARQLSSAALAKPWSSDPDALGTGCAPAGCGAPGCGAAGCGALGEGLCWTTGRGA